MPDTLAEFEAMKNGTGKQIPSYAKDYYNSVDLNLAKKYYAASYSKNDMIRDLKAIKEAMKNFEYKESI